MKVSARLSSWRAYAGHPLRRCPAPAGNEAHWSRIVPSRSGNVKIRGRLVTSGSVSAAAISAASSARSAESNRHFATLPNASAKWLAH
jgi:hypothetical protein